MIDFPASPTVGQTFTAAGASWQWDGTKWVVYGPGATPSGAMMAFAGAAAPTGWLLCSGQAVSRTTYAALFAVLSTAYGVGDGTTTFNVPDLRGRVPAGYDAGNVTGRLTASATGGVSAAALGNSGGEQAHTLGTPEIPSHNHTLTDPQHNHTLNNPSHNHTLTDPQHGHAAGIAIQTTSAALGVAAGSGKFDNTSYQFGTGNASTGITIAAATTAVTANGVATGITIAAAGGSGGHNTVPPALIVNWIIKT